MQSRLYLDDWTIGSSLHPPWNETSMEPPGETDPRIVLIFESVSAQSTVHTVREIRHHHEHLNGRHQGDARFTLKIATL